MSVSMKTGNLLESRAEALVNTVNCRGVMGAGIAKAFKDTFGDTGYFEDYSARCSSREVRLGEPYLYELELARRSTRYIITFPTKDHWKQDSKFEPIARGMVLMNRLVTERQINSIAVPALGCSNGHLDWASVCAEMYRRLGAIKAEIEFYAPLGANEAGKNLPVEIVNRHCRPSDLILPPLSLPIEAIDVLEKLSQYGANSQGIGRTQSELLRALKWTSSKSESAKLSQALTLLENNWLLVAQGTGRKKRYALGSIHKDALVAYRDCQIRSSGEMRQMALSM